MNKLELTHYEGGVRDENHLADAAAVTTEIALEFYNWMTTSDYVAKYWRRNPVSIDMNGSHHAKYREHEKILFEEFINNHYS